MKSLFRKAAAFLTAFAIVFSLSATSFASDVTTADSIRFDENGNLRVMHVTDTHLEEYNVKESVRLIGLACDKENPDIVVITGDNVQNCDNPDDTKALIDSLMTVFEERNIPVAVTFGNHDSESGAMSREELMAYYNTYSCSVSIDDGELLSGCGTYNVPVLASKSDDIAFNIWVFDSNDYDEEGNYSCVQKDQVEWYKTKSDKLAELNGGERVYSLVFQHIIVKEVYDALDMVTEKELFAFDDLYEYDKYYRFGDDGTYYGTLNERPCPGYENHGQFDAMAENGDVLAMFTGHDHTNAFGVRYKNIDITNSLSTRYNGDRYSTQYGYRIIDVNEKDTSVYTTRVEHWYDMFDAEDIAEFAMNGDIETSTLAAEVTFLGIFQKLIDFVYREFSSIVTGRQITYPD